jgi:hypothetical protein
MSVKRCAIKIVRERFIQTFHYLSLQTFFESFWKDTDEGYAIRLEKLP